MKIQFRCIRIAVFVWEMFTFVYCHVLSVPYAISIVAAHNNNKPSDSMSLFQVIIIIINTQLNLSQISLFVSQLTCWSWIETKTFNRNSGICKKKNLRYAFGRTSKIKTILTTLHCFFNKSVSVGNCFFSLLKRIVSSLVYRTFSFFYRFQISLPSLKTKTPTLNSNRTQNKNTRYKIVRDLLT